MQQNTARRLAALLALFVAACGLVVAPTAASAAPPLLAAPGDSGDDGEGGSGTLIEQLEKASSGYVKAKKQLKTSKDQQVKLVAEIKRLDSEVGPKQDTLDMLATQAYTAGRAGTMATLLSSDSAEGFLGRAETLALVATDQNRAIEDIKSTLDTQQKAKVALDLTIKDQTKQVTVMAKQKTNAEAALKAANQGAASSATSTGDSADAAPAPSGSGSGCSETDPTGTGGCLTPRTLHALNQAKAAGFTRFTKCWRTQNSGEHPKGRACDFSAEKGTFGGDATGSDKTYGNNLANYFIHNADSLDVLYVIWYRRIWLPSSGWKSYSGAGGDPSSDHTNHVHLSVN
nr:hypothetical protein Ade03nite_74810 [Actinoplanes derwentensis]